MLVDKNIIIEAKNKMAEKAALMIAEDLHLKDFDEKNLKALCFKHDEDTPSLIWNNKNNSFHCFGCNLNYSIIDHYMSFYKMTYLEACEKLFNEVGIKHRFAEKGIKTKKPYQYPEREYSSDRSKVEKYLALRGISKETLDYADVQQDKNGNIAFHYYDTNDVLLTVKYRPSKELKKGDIKCWAQKDKDTTPILFNMNKIDTTQPLVITEGEIDALAVIESGHKNTVSVPFGANSDGWIEENWDWLQEFEKIIVFSDNDTAGIQMRKNVVPRLGEWRTFIVELPEEIDGNKIKDANDVLFYCGKEKVIEYINNANEMPLANVVDLADVADYDLENAEGLYSGFSELDEHIYKFIMGTLVVLTGQAGSGKSVLLNQMFIAEALNQGYDSFLFSGELALPHLRQWIELVLAGRENVTLENKHIRRINSESRKQIREYMRNRIFVYDNPKDYSADSILDKAETLVRRRGVKLIVLDNLMCISLNANENNLWQKQKEFVVKLINFAAKYNVLVVLVAHPKKINEQRRLTQSDIAGSGDIVNLAHYVLGIHRYTKQEKEGTLDKKGGNYIKGHEPIQHDCVIDIFKNRITGVIGKEVKLHFDFPSYRFYTKPMELWKRYKWDKNKSALPKYDPKEEENIPDFLKE